MLRIITLFLTTYLGYHNLENLSRGLWVSRIKLFVLKEAYPNTDHNQTFHPNFE